MVYSPNKVVACIKVDGKILREDKNAVTLPFGAEYSVFVKNLNASRVKVRVSVDGTDATEGCWLVVDPNSELDLERFIRNGNMNSGNRFKFIERTAAIEQGPRGIKAEDGLIRIEYQVEVVKPKPIIVEEHHEHHHHDHWDYPWRPRPYTYGGLRGEMMKSSAPTRSRKPGAASGSSLSSKSLRSFESIDSADSGEFLDSGMNPGDVVGRSLSYQETSAKMDSADILVAGGAAASAPVSEIGITVPGSESKQSFRWVAGFETGPSEVIVLQLRGEIAGKVVAKAVTVETKLTCVTCGKTSRSTEKFCGKCGTALQII